MPDRERPSGTWFVLKHLLGYPNVKNYDGSWKEGGLGAASDSETLERDALGIGTDDF